jgi:hypothetical protein
MQDFIYKLFYGIISILIMISVPKILGRIINSIHGIDSEDDWQTGFAILVLAGVSLVISYGIGSLVINLLTHIK